MLKMEEATETLRHLGSLVLYASPNGRAQLSIGISLVGIIISSYR